MPGVDATAPNRNPLQGIRIMETYPDHFLLVTGTRTRGELFITTPALRKALQKRKISGKIGFITLDVRQDRHVLIYARNYRPFNTPQGNLLQGIGIGNLVELQIEKLMARRYPDAYIISGTNESELRLAQIIKRGRKPGKSIPIREAIRLSRNKAIADYQKSKIKMQLSFKGRLKTAFAWVRKKRLFSRNK